MLASGRQVIVHGIHEGTGKPYSWFGATLCETPRDKLPEIDEAGTDTLLDEISRVLVDAHGYQLAPARKARSTNGHDTEAASADWEILQHAIIAGHSLHESLRDLSCKMVCAGMEPGAVVNFLRGLMEQSAAPRDLFQDGHAIQACRAQVHRAERRHEAEGRNACRRQAGHRSRHP